MQTTIKEGKTYASINDLTNWDKNPRYVQDEDFERLKRQISELGQYKPLLVTPDGVTLGGNSRLRAFKDMGITEVWVSIINPKDETQKLKYALSDNDEVGVYDIGKLKELVIKDEIHMDLLADIKVGLGFPVSLDNIISTEQEPTDTGSGDGSGNFAIKYEIIFSKEEDLERWDSFVLFLKGKYPDHSIIGDRVIQFLNDINAG